MSGSKIKMGQLREEVREILRDYAGDVEEVTFKAAREIGRQSVGKLKGSSPMRTGAYAKHWRARTDKEGKHGIVTTVYVSGRYGRLTHLLENGHRIVTVKGATGKSTDPGNFVAPVNDWAQEEFLREIERRV